MSILQDNISQKASILQDNYCQKVSILQENKYFWVLVNKSRHRKSFFFLARQGIKKAPAGALVLYYLTIINSRMVQHLKLLIMLGSDHLVHSILIRIFLHK